MRGVRYFLVVLLFLTGLGVAARLVYSRISMTEAAPLAVQVANEPKPATQTDSSVPGQTLARQPSNNPGSAPAPTRPSPERPSPERPSPALSKPRVRAIPLVPAAVDSSRLAPPAAVVPDKSTQSPLAVPAPLPEAAPAWQATPRQLARDSAYVMVSSGRLLAAIAVLDAWVRGNPNDAEVVLDLARLKARAGDWQGSLALYTSLIEQQRTAQYLFERGQTYLWSGDSKRGEADLLASEALSPRPETERQLGDHYRWQGDFARSAQWYRLALQSAPDDTIARNAMRLLDRAIVNRLLLPGELSGNDFGSVVQAISDNAGFDLYAFRLSQAFVPVSNFVVTLSGELRSAARMFSAGASRLDAYGVDVFMASRVGLGKITASAGLLDHGADHSRIVRGSLMADGFLGSARLKATVHRAPAYETLWAPRMLSAAGRPSTTLSAQGNVSLPFGGNELYAMGEFLSVSDDNSRTAAQLAWRRRLPLRLSLLYAGSLMAYDRQTSLYYSPARYLSQSLGLEWSWYRDQGLSVALRAAPGYAWMREPAGTADSTTRDLSAFQFTSGLELGYRRGAWDLLFSSGLSSGREGGYQARNAMLYLRRAW